MERSNLVSDNMAKHRETGKKRKDMRRARLERARREKREYFQALRLKGKNEK